MPKHSGHNAEDLLSNVMETLAHETYQNNKSAHFFEENHHESKSSKTDRPFRRQKSVHNILGGGKPADLLLWRNKKISSGVLASSTTIWVLLEWLNYNFLPMTLFLLAFGMLIQFVLSNASGIFNRDPSQIPRLVIPEELFVNIAVSLNKEVNRFLGFLQDIASRGNFKQFVAVVSSLLTAAMIGSWCNLLTMVYFGFVGAHTLPVLYEKYEDEVDSFLYNLIEQLQSQFQKLDKGILNQFSKGNLRTKKSE